MEFVMLIIFLCHTEVESRLVSEDFQSPTYRTSFHRAFGGLITSGSLKQFEKKEYLLGKGAKFLFIYLLLFLLSLSWKSCWWKIDNSFYFGYVIYTTFFINKTVIYVQFENFLNYWNEEV